MRFFADRLEEFADRTAVVTDGGSTLTYRALAAETDAFAASIAGSRKLLVVETLNELPPLIAYLGALRARHPVILTDEGSTAKDRRIAETFKPYGVYCRHSGAWRLEASETDGTPELHGDLAVLLSTSGSTGSPKLVRLSHENIGTNAEAIAEYLHLNSSERAITSLPFHYSYGMSVVNSHLAVGATLLLTDESVASPKFWEFFTHQRATSFAGVPYTFELLERIRFREMSLPTLRLILQAGGRLAPEKVLDYATWSQDHGARFYVMYGQTEASPRMSYVPPELLLENSDCIGTPIPGGRFKIIDSAGDEIDGSSEAGELVYQGPGVMLGYAVAAHDLSRGRDIAELHTGDLARRNAAGLYRIVGRKSRFSKLFGQRLSLDDVEAYLSQQGVRAVVAGDDQKIVLCILRADSSPRIAELLAAKYAIGHSAIVVVEVDDFPLLPSGKIDYRAVLEAGVRAASEGGRGGDASSATSVLRNAYRWVLGKPEISAGDTFVSLGGDSLSYVEISLAIEKHLGYLPENWEETPVDKLEQLVVRRRPLPSLQTEIVLRVAAIVGVLVNHASGYWLQGGSDVLLILAGYSFARFHRSRLYAGAAVQAIVRYLVNVVLVYYAIIFAFVLIWEGGFDLDKLRWILIVNYQPDELQYLWFIQVLFQSVVIFALPFLVPSFRKWVSAYPWMSGCVIFAIALALHFASPYLDIPGLYNQHTLDKLFLFAFGWCVFFTTGRAQKLAMTGFVALLLVFVYFPVAHDIPRGIWVLCAMVLMFWTERVPIPSQLHLVLTTIASASFYIYIAQRVPILQLERTIGGEVQIVGHWWRIPDITLESIVLGIALWWAVRLGRQGLANLTPRVLTRH